MKAVAYTRHDLPITDDAALLDVTLPAPQTGPHDLLVAVEAIAVNPVDTKIRRGVAVDAPRVLGWDVAGTVLAVGAAVTRFQPGDAVYYAGALNRPGGNSEQHVVDERIAALKPRRLDFDAAAALPLTSITAWELLFDRLGVAEGGGAGQSLLIVGAAGGVGSMLIQLARQLTQLTVIATASRPQSRQWVQALGAHHVINHHEPLPPQLAALGLPEVNLVASLTHTDHYYAQLIDVLIPQGKLALIDDPQQLDAVPLKRKSLSLHWELMFTRSLYATADQVRQHELLTRVAQLVDSGVLRTTVNEHFGRINAQNLRRAHVWLESGQAVGKVVLAGFDD